jgi:hypothetical protein
VFSFQEAGENCIMRSFIIWDKIKEDKMNGACSRHRTDEKSIKNFWQII